METDLARNTGSDRDGEVDVLDRCNMLLPDHARDPGALLGRKPRAAAGLSGGDLRPALRRASRVDAAAAALAGFDVPGAVAIVTALGLHAPAIFAPFGLHAAAIFAALGLQAL